MGLMTKPMMVSTVGLKTAATARRGVSWAMGLILMMGGVAQAAGWPSPGVAMPKPWALIDLSSQQVLAGSGLNSPVSGESALALLTVGLAHEALQKGRLQRTMVLAAPPDPQIPAGPRLFVGPSGESVQTLIQGVLLIQARDAMVALGLALAGDMPRFVDQLNLFAQRVGMRNTTIFGLEPERLSENKTTISDLSILVSWLQLQAPTVFADSQVGQLSVQGIQHDNRNRLALLDEAVDGLLGSGDRAGAHLLVTMVRRQPLGSGASLERRLLVVMPEVEGFEAASRIALRLLAFGFRNFDVVELAPAGPFANDIPVYRGHRSLARPTLAQRLLVTIPRGRMDQIRLEQTLPRGLLAPIAVGEPLGHVEVQFEGQTLRRVPLVSSEPIAEAGLLGRAIDSLRLLMLPLSLPPPRP